MLQVSGIFEVRQTYWELYNAKKRSLMQNSIQNLMQTFLQSSIINEEEREIAERRIQNGEVSS